MLLILTLALLAPTQATPADPLFRATGLDGSTALGRLRQLGADGRATLAGDKGETIEVPAFFKLTRVGEPTAGPQPASPEGDRLRDEPFASPVAGPQVLLPEGDRLRGEVGAAGEASVEVTPAWNADAPLAVPLDAVVGLALAPPAEADARSALLARVRDEPREADALWLTNGDRLAGGFLDLSARRVKLQLPTGPVEVDRAGVAALGLDPRVARYPPAAGSLIELTLADGSRLGVAACRVEKGHVEATTRLGLAVKVPVGLLARAHLRDGRVRYLSEREAQAGYEGYVGPTRPYRRDLSVEGRTLRLGGQPYDRGLGVQSRTLLAYKLEPRDRRFQATVGLDDRAGPRGSVAFRVLVDRVERLATPPMSDRDRPTAIDVDVAGAQSLVLIAEFAERGEVRDLADWAEARLVGAGP